MMGDFPEVSNFKNWLFLKLYNQVAGSPRSPISLDIFVERNICDNLWEI